MITMLVLCIGGLLYRVLGVSWKPTQSSGVNISRKPPGPALFVFLSSALLLVPSASAQTAEEEDFEIIRPSATGVPPGGSDVDISRVTELITDQTNEFRMRHQRDIVEVNDRLADSARYFAEFMAREDQYGHTADGQRPSQRAKEHGYDYCIVSENIAYQFSSAGFETNELATKFVTGWRNSPGHRKNMLDRDVAETGVAVAQSNSTGYYYAVQMFGRPKTAQVEFEFANESTATVDYTIDERTYTLPPRYTRTHRRCRPSDVEFLLSEDQEETIVQPTHGDRFAITGEEGSLQITQSQPDDSVVE